MLLIVTLLLGCVILLCFHTLNLVPPAAGTTRRADHRARGYTDLQGLYPGKDVVHCGAVSVS